MTKKKPSKKPTNAKGAPPKKVRELTEDELDEISGGMQGLVMADAKADAKADARFSTNISQADAKHIQLPGVRNPQNTGQG